MNIIRISLFVILLVVATTTAITVKNSKNQNEHQNPTLNKRFPDNANIDKPLKEERWFWAAFSVLNTILGFTGSIAGTTWFGMSKASEPVYSTDDIMKKMNFEFPKLQQKIDKGFIDTVKTLRTQHSEVMLSLKTQFTQVKSQLSKIL